MPEFTVNDINSVEELIKAHEIEHSLTFRALKTDKGFGNEIDLTSNVFTIRYEDPQRGAVPKIPADGSPFTICGRKILECHQGKDRKIKYKEKVAAQKRSGDDHDYTCEKKRRMIQPSKKKDCSAMIRIRHIIKFLDYKLDVVTSHSKKTMSAKIHGDIDQCRPVEIQNIFYIYIPDITVHNHLHGEIASLVQPIDNELKTYIKKMVQENNITNPTQMKLVLDVYVTQVLFKDKAVPAKINSRFWPSMRAIRNHILLSLMEIRSSNVDQKIVEEQVTAWQSQYPSDKFFLRLKEQDEKQEVNNNNPSGPSDIDDDSIWFGTDNVHYYYGRSKKFMFVHQTPWQQRLLLRYGNEISLLDATYRTTKYSLPLYFLCIPTNVNYICVASFVIETEDQSSIEEALQVLKEWNPEWKPRYFMCDYATEEISALESIFPDSFVYLCDFHREQSWGRWLSTTHNGLTKEQEMVLSLLRPIASSYTIEEYQKSVVKLQNSDVWKSNSRLSNWFTRYWLNKSERWVQAYRHNRFNVSVNTNNGVERQNKTLKYEYLQQRKSATLSHLLSVIVVNFLPDTFKRYLQLNLSACDQHKDYAKDIPSFLHNRPKTVVDVCYTRWMESENFNRDDVDEIGDGIFLVKSQADNVTMYTVDFNENEYNLPSCSCLSWIRTHLPCKHFFAVFRYYCNWGWDSLPQTYRTNPLINLDMLDIEISTSTPKNIDFNCTRDEHLEEKPIEFPLPSNAAIRRQQKAVLSQCQEIKELIHHCKDIHVMYKLEEVFSSAITELNKVVTKNGPFIKENGDMLYIGTTEAKRIKKKYTNKMKNVEKRRLPKLPLHRRKKPGSGRFGKKADLTRKMREMKGVDDIPGQEKDHKTVIVPTPHQTVNLPTPHQTNHKTVIVPTPHQTVNLPTPHQTSTPLTEEGLEFKKRKLDQLQENVLRPKRTRVILDEGALAFKRKRITQLELQSGVYPSSGLKNSVQKNVCFANSLLQCLRVTEIHRLLQRHINCQVISCFTCQLKRFIEDGGDNAEPMLLKMKGIWPEYNIGQQQDVHEFLRIVMQEVYSKCFHDQDRNSYSEIKDLFYGMQKSKVACLNCGAHSSRDEMFSDISVSINEADSIEEAIQNYFLIQEVDYTCSVCNVTGIAHKSTTLDDIPKNLVIHINRFNQDRGKNCKNIKLAFQIDLHDYVSPGKVHVPALEKTAELFAIILHYGRTSSSGHYFCFVKFGNNWFRIDDMKIDSVRQMDIEICPQQSYLLFYRTFL